MRWLFKYSGYHCFICICSRCLCNILYRAYQSFSFIIEIFSQTLENLGFLFINQRGNPYSAQTVDSILNRIERGYCAKYPAFQIPHITPHILRHTFCTDIVNAGVDIKSVQYLMGHSTANVTLNIYAHSECDHVYEELQKKR